MRANSSDPSCSATSNSASIAASSRKIGRSTFARFLIPDQLAGFFRRRVARAHSLDQFAALVALCEPTRCPNACITARHWSIWARAADDASILMREKRLSEAAAPGATSCPQSHRGRSRWNQVLADLTELRIVCGSAACGDPGGIVHDHQLPTLPGLPRMLYQVLAPLTCRTGHRESLCRVGALAKRYLFGIWAQTLVRGRSGERPSDGAAHS
jgi:hypothetical protein